MAGERNYGLDIFRILLCFSIVLFHYQGNWSCAGDKAVDGFLVLCGFCAAVSLNGKGGIGGWGTYYRKKCWRLVPPLLVAWLISPLYCKSLTYPDVAALIENPTGELMHFMHNPALWFMTSVFTFYAVFPLLVAARKRSILLWVGVACLLFALWRSLQYPFASVNLDGLYFQPSFHLWQMLLGMWCATWPVAQWREWLRKVCIAFGVMFSLACSFIGREGVLFLNFSFPGTAFASVIFALAFACTWHTEFPPIGARGKKLITMLSGMTYSLYLLHLPCIHIVGRGLYAINTRVVDLGLAREDELVLQLCGAFCLTLLLSFLTYRYVEVLLVGKILRRTAARRTPAAA